MDKLIYMLKEKYKLFLGILLLIVSFTVILLNRGTYSTDENEKLNKVMIACPTVVSKGEEIECDLSIDSQSITTKGISGSYNLPDGITYLSSDFNGWEVVNSDENGFVLINLNGVRTNTYVGKVKFKVSEESKPNQEYAVGVTKVTLGNGLEARLDGQSLITGDVNLSGEVNSDDMEILLNHIKEVPGYEKLPYRDENTLNFGDVDSDGKVTEQDAEKLLLYIMFGEEDYSLSEIGKKCGDVNLDGELTENDVTIISSYVALLKSLNNLPDDKLSSTNLGDVNLDGKVTEDDGVYLLLHVMYSKKDYPLSEIAKKNSDVNGDGVLTTEDAIMITAYLTKFKGDQKLPIINDSVVFGDINRNRSIDETDVIEFYEKIGVVIELDDVSYDIRVKSDINTLNNIGLTGAKLNEEFKSEILEYSANTSSEIVSIELEPTDEKSTVTGGGEHQLNYGSNTINIVVTSEDGTARTYVLNIFRNYDFDTDAYPYSKTNNYIYTGLDVESSVILENIVVVEGLTKEIIDDKLVIKHNEEKVSELDIYNLNLDKYTVTSKDIYIYEKLSFAEFLSNVTTNRQLNYELKLEDQVLESSDLVLDGMKFNIYIGEEPVDTYNIVEYEFNTDTYYYNKENNFIYTGVDSDDKIIENIELEEGLTKEIIDNKLVISNADGVIEVVDIYNFDLKNYRLFNNKINIFNIITLKEFIDNISFTDALELRFSKENIDYDLDDNIINGTNLYIYYGGENIDSYVFSTYELKFDGLLNVDYDNKYIKYIDFGSDVEYLTSKVLVNNTNILVKDAEGNIKEKEDILVTGDVLISYYDGVFIESYTISVLGNANGDDVFDFADLIPMRKQIVGWINPNTNEVFNLEGVYYYALDFDENGIIDQIDLIKMRKAVVNLNY